MIVEARYDQTADFYEAATGQDVTDPAAMALLDLLGDVTGTRVLDLACGHGRVARELARRGAQVTGGDVSAELLARAEAAEVDEPLGVLYTHADATDPTALAGQLFDMVSCNYGLSDIDDLDAALATVARVLRPGGIFVFSILHPCFPGWDEDAPSAWPPGGGYYQEGWWLADNSGFRGKVGSNFRMLSTYLNTLLRHGLAIEQIAEPEPPAGWAARRPGAEPAPFALVVRSRRA